MNLFDFIKAARAGSLHEHDPAGTEFRDCLDEGNCFHYSSKVVVPTAMLIGAMIGAWERHKERHGDRAGDKSIDMAAVHACIDFLGGSQPVMEAVLNTKDTQYVLSIVYSAFGTPIHLPLLESNESSSTDAVIRRLMPVLDKMLGGDEDLRIIGRLLFVNLTAFAPKAARGLNACVVEQRLWSCYALLRKYHPIAFLIGEDGVIIRGHYEEGNHRVGV